MLQQILTEMYIDPDVLDALNDDQKKTLFLKMRQEQVRRWKEREEKLEREEADGGVERRRTKPKKDNSKSVSWLLGRDGDVAVIVIGEVDELTSKFICSGFGEKKSPALQNSARLQTILKSPTTTGPVRAESRGLPPNTQPGVSLDLKGKCEERSASLPLPVSVSEHLSPPAEEKVIPKGQTTVTEPRAGRQVVVNNSPDAAGERSALQSTSSSGNPARATPFVVRPASANAAPGSLGTRCEIQRPPAAATSTAEPKAPTGPHSQGPRKGQESQAGKEAAQETKPQQSGRVAQLMKNFSAESSAGPSQSAARGIKPPLPSKPSHLRLATTPTVR